ncbi:hypothetical protein BHM03_00062109 [Ensete ventricosum]|nr:hypothetical protein BHM03_00062109 [Ensete ventricosum]
MCNSLQVYKRSSEICMQLYEKEIFTDTSFLHIYGLTIEFPNLLLSDADLNSKQLAVAAVSTLPAPFMQMPVTSGKLQRLVKSKHPFVERHLNSVVGIIKSSIANSSAYEGITEQLKAGRLESDLEEGDCNTGSIPATDDPMEFTSGEHVENAGNHPMTNKNVNKVEAIKSTVALPFHHFSGGETTSELHVKEIIVCPVVETLQQHSADLAKLEEVIPLDRGSHEQSPSDSPMTDDGTKERDNSHHPEIGSGLDLQPESITSDEPMSPSDLTSSFEKCFQSINERRNCQRSQKSSQKPEINFNLRPFDYAAARKNVKFDDDGDDETKTEDPIKTSPDSRQMHRASGKAQGEERSRGSQQARRRQAFPPSGNRSTTYH